MVLHIRFAQKFLISQIINLQYPHIICCNFAQNTPNLVIEILSSIPISPTHSSYSISNPLYQLLYILFNHLQISSSFFSPPFLFLIFSLLSYFSSFFSFSLCSIFLPPFPRLSPALLIFSPSSLLPCSRLTPSPLRPSLVAWGVRHRRALSLAIYLRCTGGPHPPYSPNPALRPLTPLPQPNARSRQWLPCPAPSLSLDRGPTTLSRKRGGILNAHFTVCRVTNGTHNLLSIHKHTLYLGPVWILGVKIYPKVNV